LCIVSQAGSERFIERRSMNKIALVTTEGYPGSIEPVIDRRQANTR
jgi:hypothetical protein